MSSKIEKLEQAQMRSDIPEFSVGDTVKVFVRIKEDEKTRIQPFEGVVLARKGGSSRESFTVRKISFGEGIERSFPLHSPFIEKILVVKRGRVRRAKLYYLRSKIGKAARIAERFDEPTAAGKANTDAASPEVRSETTQAAQA